MKKLIAITTAAVMACAIFTGCSLGGGSSAKDNGSGSGKTPETSSVSTPDASVTDPATQPPEDTKTPDAEPSQAPEDNTQTPDGSNTAEPGQSDAEKGSAQALTDILNAVKDEYFPGTAGCSLKATELAGRLLDWNAAKTIGEADIKTAIHEFFALLGNDTAVQFVEQMNGVYEAAKDLTGDNAQSALESAGYQAEAFPWAQEDITALFTTVYDALGVDMPQEDAAA